MLGHRMASMGPLGSAPRARDRVEASAGNVEDPSVRNGTHIAWRTRMERGNSLRLRRHSRISRFALAAVVPALAIAAALGASSKGAHAADDAQDKAESNERCAIRLSIALVGKSADAAELTSANPQGAVDRMVDSPDFAER